MDLSDPQPNHQPETPVAQSEGIELTDKAPAYQPSVVAPQQPSTTSPQTTHKRLVILLTASILLVVAACYGTYAVIRPAAVKTATIAPNVNKYPYLKLSDIKPSAVPKPFQNTFLQTAQPLVPAPTFFKDYGSVFGTNCAGLTPNAQFDDNNCPPSIGPSGLHYATIGVTKANQPIILVTVAANMADGRYMFVALRTSPTTYSILAKPSGMGTDKAYLSSFKRALDASTTLDTTTELPDLQFPLSFVMNGTQYVEAGAEDSTNLYQATGIGDGGLTAIRTPKVSHTDLSQISQQGTFGPYNIYTVTAKTTTTYDVKEVFLTINSVYTASYRAVSNLYAGTTALAITWNDGTKNNDMYDYAGLGCAEPYNYMVVKGVGDGLSQIGTGPHKEKLYALPSNSSLLQEIYTQDYGTGEYASDKSDMHLNLEQFQAKHALFVAKNAAGEYVLYQNQSFFTGGGCGKPVVYLYPTHNELVNVSVSADVRKSEPTYAADGWRNVLAHPSGQLTYQGKAYDNLFWEGYGYGSYPEITSGTVVARNQAVSIIRQQLSEQGLKASEITDFMAYWQPRLPNAPYVRLSWLTTDQLNELAPLQVSPKPQTLIRVFLDFQGLNKPVAMPAQKFEAPARNGFTVVEWGALERGGL